MKNTFGQNLSVTVFGESHGDAIGVVIDGISPGTEVDTEKINEYLAKRRPSSAIDTPRREKDNFRILSGVFKGMATGTPILIEIPNENTKSDDYSYGLARPSHADYSAFCKYHGFEDYRGGGHFSGRVTAGLVAAGGILLPALEKLGIFVGTHILKCGNAEDFTFSDIKNELTALKKSDFPTISLSAKEEITAEILKASENSDSIGGITETAVYGLPKGLGEPWFDSVEGLISHGIFSIGGIKGIAFGKGFDFANATGKTANDEFAIENGKIITKTNNNGGINGGITNGMPITFTCSVKPTPSIALTQQTVDFIKSRETEINIKGRHDPAIIRRICPVIDSVTAIVLCDLLIGRFGEDVLLKGVPKCNTD